MTVESCDGSPSQQFQTTVNPQGNRFGLTSATHTDENENPIDPTNPRKYGLFASMFFVDTLRTSYESADFDLSLMRPVSDAAADMTARIVGVDQNAKTATIAGTGEPGATVMISPPVGAKITAVVRTDGTWGPTTIAGLAVGENLLTLVQTFGGVTGAPITLTIPVAANANANAAASAAADANGNPAAVAAGNTDASTQASAAADIT
ncbi:hypothetical protein, partial [Microbacterium sp. NPDC055665]